MKYLSTLVLVIAIGCGVNVSHEISGGMSVVEQTEVNGKTVCKLYAKNRQLSEVLDLVKPKLEVSFVVDDSVDVGQVVREVDIQADDWQSLLKKLGQQLNLKLEYEGESLTLVDGD